MKLPSRLISIAYGRENLIGLSDDGSLHILKLSDGGMLKGHRCILPPHSKKQKDLSDKKTAWQIDQDLKRARKLLAEFKEDKDNYEQVLGEAWEALGKKSMKATAKVIYSDLKRTVARLKKASEKAVIREAI